MILKFFKCIKKNLALNKITFKNYRKKTLRVQFNHPVNLLYSVNFVDLLNS